MEPRVATMEPSGPPKCQKDAKVYPKGAKMEAQGAQWSPKITQSAKNTPHGLPKCHCDTKICPRRQKTSKHTQTQTTNPPNKQREAHINKQPHKHTTQANKHSIKQTNTPGGVHGQNRFEDLYTQIKKTYIPTHKPTKTQPHKQTNKHTRWSSRPKSFREHLLTNRKAYIP